jgi:hypothetical protein
MLDETITKFSDIDAPVRLPDIVTLSNSQRKRILDNKTLIVKFISALEKSVFDDISSGDEFEGYKIVEGRGRRQWRGDAARVLEEKLGDKAYRKSLIRRGEAMELLSKSEVDRLLVSAVHFGLANFPVAYCGLKIITSLSLRFPDFQRRFASPYELNPI